MSVGAADRFTVQSRADAGARAAEPEALFGWHGGGMASLYMQEADRRRLAQQAAAKLLKSPRQSARNAARRKP